MDFFAAGVWPVMQISSKEENERRGETKQRLLIDNATHICPVGYTDIP